MPFDSTSNVARRVKAVEGSRKMTASVLNSSKMRSRSSGDWSSAKAAIAVRGGAITLAASSTLYCSSLQHALICYEVGSTLLTDSSTKGRKEHRHQHQVSDSLFANVGLEAPASC